MYKFCELSKHFFVYYFIKEKQGHGSKEELSLSDCFSTLLITDFKILQQDPAHP